MIGRYFKRAAFPGVVTTSGFEHGLSILGKTKTTVQIQAAARLSYCSSTRRSFTMLFVTDIVVVLQ
jgi:hypothetical protein